MRKVTEIGFAAQFDTPVTQVPNLPPDLLDTHPFTALATVAALLSRPNLQAGGATLVSEDSLAVRLLALGAGGSMARCNAEQFRHLDRLAAKFGEQCGNAELAEYVKFVRRQAYDVMQLVGRHRRPAEPKFITAPGKPLPEPTPQQIERLKAQMHEVPADFFQPKGWGDWAGQQPLDLESGRGYSNLAAYVGPSIEYLPLQMRLLTYATLFAAALPRCCNTRAEAIIMLALYAAGARIELTKQQFRTLEDRARQYTATMRGGRYTKFKNHQFAMEALFTARLRARRSGLLPSVRRKRTTNPATN